MVCEVREDTSRETEGGDGAEGALLSVLFALPGLSPAHASPPCPEADLLAGYAEGRLLPRERARVEAHLARCASCLELSARLASREAHRAAATASPFRPGLPRLRKGGVCLAVGAAMIFLLLCRPQGDDAHLLRRIFLLFDRCRTAEDLKSTLHAVERSSDF